MSSGQSHNESTERLRRRASEIIPGGSHTYAKGDDQYPTNAPPFIVRGKGCHIWDREGRRYIEYGMGLRSVTLGHAFGPVIDAVRKELEHGSNFNRPSPIEVECAEEFLGLVSTADMVKFCKDGSDALDGAVRLARAFTGRDMIAICGDHPFFSTSDWFIGSTVMNAGVPQAIRDLTVKFRYNDLSSLEALFAQFSHNIACVVMEPARIEGPRDGYLDSVKEVVHRHGALLVFDEMITGFRWHAGGAHQIYGVAPDMSTFGKAIANGFSVSALAGRKEILERGGVDHEYERVFLLSTTHGGETHALAAALATMRFYRNHDVIGRLHSAGARLRAGIDRSIEEHGLADYVQLLGRDCCLLYATRDAALQPSQDFRTLFLKELVTRGVLAPSFVVAFSHSDEDVDLTIDAVHSSLAVYRAAIESGLTESHVGRSVKPVLRKFS